MYKDQLEDLRNFTERIDKEIGDIASTLNWTVGSIQNHDGDLLTCTYDSSHRVSKESFDRHLESCQWKTEGYGKYDVPMSVPGTSSGTGSSIKFDVQLQSNVLWNAQKQNPEMRTEINECYTWHGLDICLGERLIPRTSDRLLTDFTSDERAALYEYVVSHTVKPEVGQDITDEHRLKSQDKDKVDPQTSFLELLVQERNLKRRRAKHRGVHTNKKSQIEILREVINQQMELYISCLREMRENVGDTEEQCYGPTEDVDMDADVDVHGTDVDVHSSRTEREISTHRNSGRPSVQEREQYERSEKKHSSRTREHGKREKREKREKHSPRKHRRHERKHRSRSRERGIAKEVNHRSKSAAYKKHLHGSRHSETGSHSRHSSDRRRDR